MIYHFYQKEWKLKKAISFYDKNEYFIHIRNLKQVLNHGLVLKKVHRVIKFTQNALLKSYIDMNNDLRKIKLMNDVVFAKTKENVRKHKDIKFITTE